MIINFNLYKKKERKKRKEEEEEVIWYKKGNLLENIIAMLDILLIFITLMDDGSRVNEIY